MSEIDIYNTGVLRRVVRELDEPSSFLLTAGFPMIEESNTREIHFDVEAIGKRITPFVAPIVAGQVVENEGFTTKTFSPAYAKDKRQLQPDEPLRRTVGEQIGGSMTPMQRRMANLARTIENQVRMLTLREEVMAAEALRTGKVTIEGEKYPLVEVDFGRHQDLTVALTNNDRWTIDHADSTPLDDLEEWSGEIQDKAGAVANLVVMEPSAWRAFRAKEEVQKALDTRRGSASRAETGPLDGRKARFVGFVGDFEIWVYQESYIDPLDGQAKSVMPAGTVLLFAPGEDGLQGVRHYGLIQDEAAGYNSSRFHVKTWLEQDPAVRWVLLQSAPLVVPYRVNATLGATVL